MQPRFASHIDFMLVAIGGAMGAARCQGFGLFVGVGARCEALFLVFQIDRGPRSHGVRAVRMPKTKLDTAKPPYNSYDLLEGRGKPLPALIVP